MAVDVIADETCAALSRVTQPLDPAAVHRFLIGADPGPVKLADADAAELLGYPLATLLLRFLVATGEQSKPDIEIAGRPIEYGAQLADNVQIKLTAVAAAFGSHSPQREPCL